jgi:hypothetical protein
MRDHLVLCGLGQLMSVAMPSDSQYNLLALSVIRSNDDDDQLTAIEDNTCAYEMWNALHAAHAAARCNARGIAHSRTAGFPSFGQGKDHREYGRRAIDIRRSLLDVGAACGEEKLIEYVLLGLPSSYHTIWMIVGDSKESNLEEVLRRLARYQEQELKQGSDTPESRVALSSQEGRHSSETASGCNLQLQQDGPHCSQLQIAPDKNQGW